MSGEKQATEPSAESLAEIPEVDFAHAIRPNRYANLRGEFRYAVPVTVLVRRNLPDEDVLALHFLPRARSMIASRSTIPGAKTSFARAGGSMGSSATSSPSAPSVRSTSPTSALLLPPSTSTTHCRLTPTRLAKVA